MLFDVYQFVDDTGTLVAAYVQQGIVIDIGTNDAPVVNIPIADQSSPEDAPWSFQFPENTFTDAEDDALVYTATLANGDPLPGTLTFDPVTRTFSGTPPQNFNGPLEIRVTASDNTNSASDTFTLNVTAANDAPVVNIPIADQSSPEDAPWSFQVPANTFTDVENDALFYTAALTNGDPLPGTLTFDPVTRTFSGTPPQNFNGSIDIRVTATDGTNSTSDTFTLNITAANDAPVVVNGESVSLAAISEDNTNPPGTTLASLLSSHFSDAADNQSANGGTAANTLAGFAIYANPSNPAVGSWQWSSDGSNWNAIPTNLSDSNALVLTASALVRFVPAADYNGAAPQLIGRLIDSSAGPVVNGATVNLLSSGVGGATPYSSAPITVSETITPVNDKPVVDGPNTGTVTEDAAISGRTVSGQLTASDPDNASADIKWTVQGGSQPGPADYSFRIDHFKITGNGQAIVFQDAFDNGNPPPSPSYATTGTFTESNGYAVLSSNGALNIDAVGTASPLVGQFATATGAATLLQQANDFTVEGTFELLQPDDVREGYGIRVTDNVPGTPGNDTVELLVVRGSSGNVALQLRDVNFSTDTTSVLEAQAFSVQPGEVSIVLRLIHGAGDDHITAAADIYLAGGVFSRTIAFETEVPVFDGQDLRGGFFALAPDPTVSTLSGTYGTLSIDSNGQWTYGLNNISPEVQALGAGDVVFDTFTVLADDGNGGVTEQTITITVNGTNDAPVLTLDGDTATTAEDTTVHLFGGAMVDVDAAAGELFTLRVTVQHGTVMPFGGFPDDVIPIDFNGADGSFEFQGTLDVIQRLIADGVEYTPSSDYNGADTMTVTVTDGSGAPVSEVSEEVKITVDPVNDAPVATDDIVPGLVEGMPSQVSDNALTNDDDADDDSLTVTGLRAGENNGNNDFQEINSGQITVTGEYGTLLILGNGTYTYTLNNSDPDTQALTDGEQVSDVFTYRVSDGEATDTAEIRIGITGTNDAPVLAGDLAATVEHGDAVVLTTDDLSFTDPDNDASDVTFTVSSLNHGTIFVDGVTASSFSLTQLQDGLVSFVHDGSQTSTASFQVVVEDGNEDGSTPVASTFNLTVTPPNSPPVLALGGVSIFDGFNTQQYDGWTEADDDSEGTAENGSPTEGEFQIAHDPTTAPGELALRLSDLDSESDDPDTIERSFDLDGVSSATLSFDYRRNISDSDDATDDRFFVQLSVDGGGFFNIGQIGATMTATSSTPTISHSSST